MDVHYGPRGVFLAASDIEDEIFFDDVQVGQVIRCPEGEEFEVIDKIVTLKVKVLKTSPKNPELMEKTKKRPFLRWLFPW